MSSPRNADRDPAWRRELTERLELIDEAADALSPDANSNRAGGTR